MNTYTTSLHEALAALIRRLDAGEEFPDATYRVAATFEVSQDDLVAAYDDQ
jgi:hypothetical protein